MLRGLRVWRRSVFHSGDSVLLSAHRRGILCSSLDARVRPLRPSTRSSAARLTSSWRWLVPRLRDEENKTQREDSMKYLLMIVAAIALVGTANATSRSADCCGGGACCLIKL